MNFIMPPRIYRDSGEVRKVGFEIEFGGLDLESTAQIIKSIFGGTIEKKHHFSYRIKDTKFGEFTLESDARFLSQKKYELYLQKIGIPPESAFTDNVEKFFEKISGTLLPFEIAMPPIPMDQLQEAEKIREEMFKNSALGISSSVFAAFGMQFNPELPDFRVETILSYLKAFLLLYDWLAEETDIVIARRVAPYIHPFSKEYTELVLNPDYNPDLEKLIHDYLVMNPTRNRPLDMLPLFCFLDCDLVLQFPVEKDLIKPRPTFHYRLPNSEIDDPMWSFAKEWNKWVCVEKLACDPKQLEQLTKEYFEVHHAGRLFVKVPWIMKTREWLNAHP